MDKNEIWQAIDAELKRAKKNYPVWPDHIVSRAGIVCEESGELMQACLQIKYDKGKKGRSLEEQKQLIKMEAVQTAVTAIRFLENLKL